MPRGPFSTSMVMGGRVKFLENIITATSINHTDTLGDNPVPRMPVTTRITIFLGSGIPINLHLPLLLGGGQPNR